MNHIWKTEQFLLQSFCEIFDRMNCYYICDKHKLSVTIPMQGCDIPVSFCFHLDTANYLIVISSSFSFQVPVKRRMDMALLLTLVNHQLIDGTFLMDYPSGKVSFRTTAGYENSLIDSKCLFQMFRRTVEAVDDHIGDLYKLCLGKPVLTKYLK